MNKYKYYISTFVIIILIATGIILHRTTPTQTGGNDVIYVPFSPHSSNEYDINNMIYSHLEKNLCELIEKYLHANSGVTITETSVIVEVCLAPGRQLTDEEIATVKELIHKTITPDNKTSEIHEILDASLQ